MQNPSANQLNSGPPEPSDDPFRRPRTGPWEPNPWWLFPLFLAALVAAVVLLGRDPDRPAAGRPDEAPTATWTPLPAPAGEQVALTIDFGNGARREFDALPWREGMTVGDAMAAAREFQPAIAYTQRGTAAGAFLTSLEGVANEGSDGRNWLYRVDDLPGESSFAVHPLAPGQRVLWIFDRGE